jgi:hypothetical protein
MTQCFYIQREERLVKIIDFGVALHMSEWNYQGQNSIPVHCFLHAKFYNDRILNSLLKSDYLTLRLYIWSQRPKCMLV